MTTELRFQIALASHAIGEGYPCGATGKQETALASSLGLAIDQVSFEGVWIERKVDLS